MTDILKYKTKVETIVDAEYVGTECHKCGKISDNRADAYYHHTYTGGYENPFGDMATVCVSLCRKCAIEVLAPYVRYVEVDGYDFPDAEDFYCGDFENCTNRWCEINGGCSNLEHKHKKKE